MFEHNLLFDGRGQIVWEDEDDKDGDGQIKVRKKRVRMNSDRMTWEMNRIGKERKEREKERRGEGQREGGEEGSMWWDKM